MPKAIDGDEDETLDLTADMEIDDQADPDSDEADGDSVDGGDDPDAGDGDGEEETVISFDDAPAEDADQPGDSSTIRNLRKELRDAKRKALELERATAKPKVELPPKPTLAGCGFDEEEYETKLDEWKATEAAVKAEEATAEEQSRRANESWQADLQSLATKKAALGISDYADAEDAVKTSLNLVQQAVIVKAAADPAAFIYALGKSEAKLAELAKFEDPIKMAAAVARMEGTVKVTTRRKGPAIDKPAQGSGKLPQGDAAKRMEALEKEAERTGDRTKLISYRKQQAAKK